MKKLLAVILIALAVYYLFWGIVDRSKATYIDYCQQTQSPSPSPSPSDSPSPSPSPSDSPSPSPSPSIEPSPDPSDSPSPSPSSTPSPSDTPLPPQHDEASKPPAYVCTITKQVANPLVWRRGDEAIVQWQPTEGDKANIYYKQVKSADWQYSVLDTPNDGYEVIKGLGSLDISFAVQQECGPLSKTIVDGPTRAWILFR